jgi:hypothetical protein
MPTIFGLLPMGRIPQSITRIALLASQMAAQSSCANRANSCCVSVISLLILRAAALADGNVNHDIVHIFRIEVSAVLLLN